MTYRIILNTLKGKLEKMMYQLYVGVETTT